VVVDAEKKEKERNERENLFQVKRKKCVQKEFDRADIVRDAWFVPAQTVDAKPSSQLIRQHFPLWRTDLSGCTQSDPGQDGVPFESTLADDA
jgi:hypothetical protein